MSSRDILLDDPAGHPRQTTTPEPPLSHEEPSSAAPPEVIGPYRVLHQIGSGVLGPVYRVLAPDTDDIVAVKLFRLDWPPEQAHALAGAFQTLIETLPAHPSIVAPRAAGLDGATVWLAQDLVAADSLDARMRRRTAVGAEALVAVLRQVAAALDAGAEAGWRHGALHPRDVLVDTTGRVRVTGIGVAQLVERFGARPPRRRPFAAPERSGGQPWDARADVFALAVMAAEWLAPRRGRPGSETLAATLDRAGFDGERALHVLEAATSATPTDRPPTALGLVEALAAAIDPERAARTRTPAPGSLFAAIEPAPAQDASPALVDVDPDSTLVAPSPEVPPDVPLDAPPREDARVALEASPAPPALAPPHEPEEVEVAAPPRFAGVGGALALEDLDLRAPVLAVNDPPAAVDLGTPGSTSPAGGLERDDLPAPGAWEAPGLARVSPAIVTTDTGRGSWADEPAAWEPADPDPPAPRTPWAEPADRPLMTTSQWMVSLAAVLLLGVALGFFLGRWSVSPALSARPGASPGATSAPVAGPTPVQDEPVLAEPPSGPAAQAGSGPGAAPVGARPPAPAPPPATPAPARREPPAATGRLVVRTTPAGARVRVDGRDRGVTPLTLTGLAPGRYAVEVSLEGHEPLSRRVELTSARPTATLDLRLPAAPRPAAAARGPASLEFVTRPAGAVVWLDGRRVGVSPLTLSEVAPGTRSVRFELAGHATWTNTITLAAGESRRVTASLEPRP